MVGPTLIYSSVFMSFIVTFFNFSLSSAIMLSSINFRRIENIMLSELLAFVQTTLLIKNVPLCCKVIFAEGRVGVKCKKEGKKKKYWTEWDQTKQFKKVLLPKISAANMYKISQHEKKHHCNQFSFTTLKTQILKKTTKTP